MQRGGHCHFHPSCSSIARCPPESLCEGQCMIMCIAAGCNSKCVHVCVYIHDFCQRKYLKSDFGKPLCICVIVVFCTLYVYIEVRYMNVIWTSPLLMLYVCKLVSIAVCVSCIYSRRVSRVCVSCVHVAYTSWYINNQVSSLLSASSSLWVPCNLKLLLQQISEWSV